MLVIGISNRKWDYVVPVLRYTEYRCTTLISTHSNAFFILIRAAKVGMLWHFLFRIIDDNTYTWSIHSLSGQKPFCSSANRSWFSQPLDKTAVERRQNLCHPRSINPNMINHVPQQSPLISKSYMLSVHEAIKISYSYHLPCQGSRNCQKSDVSNHSFVDMVRSPFQYCPSI